MSGVSTTEDGCPFGCHFKVRVSGSVGTYCTISLILSSSIKSLIQSNNNNHFLVNVSFISDEYNDTNRISSCTTGFYSYAGDNNYQTISNNIHQSSAELYIIGDVYNCNYIETYTTWENIPDTIDTYGVNMFLNAFFVSSMNNKFLLFSGIVYYRFEMIVYEG